MIYVIDMNYILKSYYIIFVLWSFNSYSQEISFDSWKENLANEAISNGISKKTLSDTFDLIKEPNKKVLALYYKQPERALTFKKYIKNTISNHRIKQGKKLLIIHKKKLNFIAKKYGVQPRFIIAIWGLETNYGKNMGGFKVISSLATLAYESKRKKFFRNELITALLILEHGHIDKEKMYGSWAGAMGQSQFMPSSFIKYAKDENQNKKIDIWSELDDVFASIANYLNLHGWTPNKTWGREVLLPENFDYTLIGIKNSKFLSEWTNENVLKIDGNKLPDVKIKASIIKVGKNENRFFIVYNNFKRILNYNNSHYYGLSVGLLSDSLL